MTASVHPVFDRVRSDLDSALQGGELTPVQAVEWLSALARGGEPTMPTDVSDTMCRVAWLMFVRAPALSPQYLALAPMYLGFLSSGQRGFVEVIEELEQLERDHSAEETDSLDALLTHHGASLLALLRTRTGGGEGAADRVHDMADRLHAKARELAAAGRWDEVPLGGPDASAAAAALRVLPQEVALDIYDAWMSAERAASEEQWEQAISSLDAAASLSSHIFETFVRRAKVFFASGDRVRGGADLERALSLHRGSAVARAMRAELRVTIRDLVGSLEDWNVAVESAPHAVGFRIGRAFTHLASGNHNEALADFSAAVDMAPEDSTPRYNRADVYVRMGNLEGALGDYDEILSRTPDDPQARVNRGTVQLMRRAAEPAIEDFTAVLEARPMYAMAYGKRASGEMMRGRPWAAWLDAMTALATGGEDWPHREPVSRMLHAAHQALDGTPHAKASAHDVAVRLDLLRTKATGSEVVRFIDLLGENLPSELLDLHLLRGKAYTDYGRWDEAGAAYRDALAFDDGHVGAWLGVGRALVHIQAFEDATAALQRAADGREQLSESDRFELALAQGRVAGAQQRLVEAVGHFDAALTLQPERADVWFYKGVHLDLAGDREGALAAYNESITRNHTFAPAWFNRACEHSVLGHRSEALDDLRRAVALDPSWGPAAAKDDYFASLWSDPEFQEVVASGGGA